MKSPKIANHHAKIETGELSIEFRISRFDLHFSAHRRRNHAQFFHQLRELFGIEGLRAVAQRLLRVVVNLNQQAIRTRGQ